MIRTKVLAAFVAIAISPICSAGDPVAGPGTPDLAAQWWQWAMSATQDKNPVVDLTGANCATNQSGATWFLAGGFGSSKIRRTCTVPAGKTLFFPLVNMVYTPARGVPPITCADTKAAAALNNDTAIDLFAELDGTPISQLKQYRVSSDKCFDALARQPASLQPYKAFPSATDGFWLLLKPLSAGRHTLKFGGKYNRQSADYGHMVQDIEYVLLVQ